MSNRYVSTPLRRTLEKAIKEARTLAEDGARDAIRRLGVADAKAPSYLGDREKDLRRRLRAHARALGDPFDKATEQQAIKKLTEATAYAHWHRMLFARFLAERGLLRHPKLNAPVTIEECREFAAEENVADGWAAAERYAAAMLPAVFRTEDPVLSLDFDAAHTQKLSRLVTGLDAEIFQAEDSLGWTYQFWRAAEKDAVNKSGVKVGADELPAVTQLFTEPYMVRFLLHNTLGAWWAGKRLAVDAELAGSAADEEALRTACSPQSYHFDMLRFVRENEHGPWRPAAGTFPGWPMHAKAITMLDPCCGSGHFLTEALTILSALRQAEEDLSPPDAVAAVLRDNLHGLEIDGRCVQIAAFAVALTAWRIGGWQALPLPHIAWVGAPPPLLRAEFVALADGDADLERALAALHDLFAQAPILGSLLKPIGGDLVDPARIAKIDELLVPLLAKVRSGDPERMEGVIAARGMADAVAILSRSFYIQATNVPFLGRAKQSSALSTYLQDRHPSAKADLATAMLDRMRRLSTPAGCLATVSPQNWLFLGTYKKLRQEILSTAGIALLADLGPAAFQDMNWWAARTILLSLTEIRPDQTTAYAAIDADTGRDFDGKQSLLASGPLRIIRQNSQFQNPDSRITLTTISSSALLSSRALYGKGSTTGDRPRFLLRFWELQRLGPHNVKWLNSPSEGDVWGGRSEVTTCALHSRSLVEQLGCRLHGQDVIGRPGVAVNKMNNLEPFFYDGEVFDDNVGPIVPIKIDHLPAIAAYIFSPHYREAVRKFDQVLKVTAATLVKVPFDLEQWKMVATQRYPSGIPEPYSHCPANWLYHGHPKQTTPGASLHVALARLCGYRWPSETGTQTGLSKAAGDWLARVGQLPASDSDGLLGVPSIGGQTALADRLRSYLSTALDPDWSDGLERRLVGEADEVLDEAAKDTSLDGWLRDRAFRQHCILFHQRPFLWHIWDGLKDGFSVFVHYHRFDQASLRKLTYTLLGDWLARAKAEKNDLRYERARELQQKLEKILEGEVPYDIFVRWKPLSELPIGWDPDLDDGVRLNIRPFVEAGILRETPKIKWSKDRGSDVTSAPWYPVFKGERINDHHATLADKRSARGASKKAAGGAS